MLVWGAWRARARILIARAVCAIGRGYTNLGAKSSDPLQFGWADHRPMRAMHNEDAKRAVRVRVLGRRTH